MDRDATENPPRIDEYPIHFTKLCILTVQLHLYELFPSLLPINKQNYALSSLYHHNLCLEQAILKINKIR